MHPAVETILKYFEYEHLPENLQAISVEFYRLAYLMAENKDLDGRELTVGLRKLLEAKDCMVRAAIK